LLAGMAELADAHGSGPCDSNILRVRLPFPARYDGKFREIDASLSFYTKLDKKETFPMEIQAQKHILYLDVLRILAAFLVVTIHVSSFYWYGTSHLSINWIIMNYADSLSRVGVPLFIILSGSLFLSRKKIDWNKFYTINCFRIMLIYIFWQFFYIFDTYGFHVPEEPSPWFLWFDFKYHLWFLPYLFGVYLILPILRTIVERRRLYHGILLLGFIWSLCKSVWLLLPYFLGNEFLLKTPNWVVFLEFVFYFFLGYYLKESKTAIPVWIFGVGYLLLSLFNGYATERISRFLGYPSASLYDNFTMAILASSICVFLFIKDITQTEKIHRFFTSKKKMLKSLSSLTLGVYLLHPFFLEHLSADIHLDVNSFPIILSIPLISMIVFGFSLLTGFLFRKIPYLGRYLI
jgi:surface polysaccharide O-acyltransferase-like enzyme